MHRSVLCLFVAIFLVSCASKGTPAPRATVEEAEDSLVDFFALLNSKEYEDADTLYGASYEQLQVFNPDVDPNDHATLWKKACKMSGLQCLQVRTAALKHQEGDTYIFAVEFSNSDDSLFVLGPCCGSNETEMPPVSQFEYTVSKNAEGKFVVMTLPPYVP
ncbi:MAG TPA: hypothetical protein VK249_21005 [Anaerolineales bacterium]|nr:hypothetical protein [Anaerolineales bacterium]